MRRTRQRSRAAKCAAFALIAVVAASVFALNSTGDQPPLPEDDEAVDKGFSYAFRIYALNQTGRQSVGEGTFFSFNETDFPHEVHKVRYGDHRTDAQYSSVYFSSSGLLLWANGARDSVRLCEADGYQIVEFMYGGQELVVLGGEERYTSNPECLVHSGTNILVSDWLDGSWSPDEGILLEHSGNITFSSATFFVMVFEPTGVLAIPEFGVLPVALSALCALILLADRRRKWNREHKFRPGACA